MTGNYEFFPSVFLIGSQKRYLILSALRIKRLVCITCRMRQHIYFSPCTAQPVGFRCGRCTLAFFGFFLLLRKANSVLQLLAPDEFYAGKSYFGRIKSTRDKQQRISGFKLSGQNLKDILCAVIIDSLCVFTSIPEISTLMKKAGSNSLNCSGNTIWFLP